MNKKTDRRLPVKVKKCVVCGFWQRAWVIDSKPKFDSCKCGEPFRHFESKLVYL